jgi:RHS repeat-associated protein
MIRIASPEPTSIFAYTGRPLDDDADLQFDRARHYDPTEGQFISNDSAACADDADLYPYVGNSPE